MPGKKQPKQKRRGRNEGSVYLRADGRWSGTVDFGYDSTGKRVRKTVYGKTRKEAHEKLQSLLEDKRRGLVEPTTITVQHFIEQNLTERSSKLRPRTQRAYRSAINQHVLPAIGKLRLANVKPLHIDRIYRNLEANGKHATACVVRNVLRPAFRKARRLGVIATDPTADVDSPKADGKPRVTWTPEQAETFLMAIKESRDYALYCVAITTGMRLGELCALRWENVRMDEAELDVVGTIGSPGDAELVGPPKTESSRRTVAMPAAAVDALHERRKQNLAEGNGASPWAFCALRGGNLWPGDIRERKDALMTAAGVPVIRLHDIRHFMPTVMLSQDANPKIVSKSLGHKSVQTTLDIYSHVDKSHLRALSDRMDSIMPAKRKSS
ncbi:site-specific integrase [Symmachiella dynata]|uniref:site-specific integrase n=1 Tax=Symmachiella dynata TaxID=2527995 RepID=UPI0030EE2A32